MVEEICKFTGSLYKTCYGTGIRVRASSCSKNEIVVIYVSRRYIAIAFYSLSIFNVSYLLTRNTIRFIGGHLAASPNIYRVRFKETDFISPYTVRGLMPFIVIMRLVKTIVTFTSSPSKTGASSVVIWYVELFYRKAWRNERRDCYQLLILILYYEL